MYRLSQLHGHIAPNTSFAIYKAPKKAAPAVAANLVQVTLPDGKSYDQPTKLFINNEWVDGHGGSIESVNPATEQVICSVEAADESDVDKAVQAARNCYENVWRKVTGAERAQLMRKLADLVEKNKDLLTSIEAADSGKPKYGNCDGDVDELIYVLRYYSGLAEKAGNGVTISTSNEKFAYTIHEPYGVCGQIIPWNYPIAMAAWKLGPCLAAGNVLVMKLSEYTPLSMLVICNLVKEAGFPPGVVNVVNGYGAKAGNRLAEHPDVDKIAFTGSTATGRSVMKAATGNMKAVTMELGGKSPLLIFDDCDLAKAIEWAHIGIMYNMGQVCSATSRILVQEGIADKFVEGFIKQCNEASILGCPLDQKTSHGPQVNKIQYEKVLGYIEKGKAEGAKCILGGEAAPQNGKGYFIKPTAFTNVNKDMTIWKEEIFGPVVVIDTFKTEEEAIAKANDTPYGLAAALFTENIRRAHRVVKELRAGQVWVNSDNDSDPRVPFGGVKQSGIGRELGEYGLSIYTQAKAVHINLD
ncbi:aldehyde dehydrogenase domain-containing protein [Yarrowia lipolytica]|jgi:aldehyde dehydrogenase (NAD+)|uniref:Aldehyde dehydrogenase domain-containing protein n=2 Tax=Yarrowia lipolytica TaxID=4952 RepID=A0A1D8NDP7_YARLL|nr:hypothetical protein YALI1_D10197g [Yarrowia lipolytica]KAJ8054652.1 aldehyde dehydrogenase domain-containing protein [Yarrowia lipolytica]